ncbi:anti-sigma factor family protein [Amycolatopsis anabasis]|uniref:anti-sigma factor family protein n=1 Tax=Amycolatopsis anabasis TaxID=1840409 RepID=UPI00131B856D|nr:zf-HC2 domain-containing protein [Amycolatopsis anabasis]
MSAVEHESLGAYVLGALDDREASAFERHLDACPACRREFAELMRLRSELDEVPPEAFLDGPPEGGDLLLQRTLRQAREAEPEPPRRSRRWAVTAGVAAAVLVALGGGVVLGRQTAPDNRAAPSPPPPLTSVPPAGVRTLAATDPGTGAALVAAVTPAAGWVRVHATVQGVHQGEKCLLVVTPKQGQPMIAGSWLVSAKGEAEGTGLDGSALVAPNEVASVDVVTTDGRKLVSAKA